MQFFKKEKIGKKRIITICGLKFEYRTGRKYKFEKVTKSGLTDIKRNPQIIVSLTSFPDRIPFIYKTISSLLNQTLKPDMVILWLAKEQFPQLENNLPDELLELKKYGLTIKWCNNIRSYKKLVPAIKEYPNDIIITADDDIYYDKTLIELLYKSYEKEPQYIHCHRCTKIFYKNFKKVLTKPQVSCRISIVVRDKYFTSNKCVFSSAG